MNAVNQSVDVVNASLEMANTHYENFPVASVLLPQKLREPVAMIYAFARQADDFADEGNDSIATRLQNLQNFRDELDLIRAYIQPDTSFFKALRGTIQQHALPMQPFYDLLDAFSQDVEKVRYANFDEVLDYCRRSANPVGNLLLHLHQSATPENIKYSDDICSALQLINFYQDVAIDFAKNDGKKRIYLCQDEMQAASITEDLIAKNDTGAAWQAFMLMNITRAEKMLLAGKPLGKILKGRFGLEIRMIIAGGERMIAKLKACKGDIYHHRPTLNKWDWVIMATKAILKL